MAVEDATDRAAFFDPDEFGVAATYNGATTVNGIFDNEYFEAVLDTDVPAEGLQLLFLCRAQDVPNAAHGDTLVISGATYVVRGVQPDGEGIVVLVLEAQ